MEILWFVIGYGAGMATGRFGSESQPVSQRYALFLTQTENEALQKITEAYTHLYEKPPEIVGFDDDGDLVTRVQNTGMFGRVKIREECDSSVSIERFLREQLLKVELYDTDMDPIGENIMLARYLADNSKK